MTAWARFGFRQFHGLAAVLVYGLAHAAGHCIAFVGIWAGRRQAFLRAGRLSGTGDKTRSRTGMVSLKSGICLLFLPRRFRQTTFLMSSGLCGSKPVAASTTCFHRLQHTTFFFLPARTALHTVPRTRANSVMSLRRPVNSSCLCCLYMLCRRGLALLSTPLVSFS